MIKKYKRKIGVVFLICILFNFIYGSYSNLVYAEINQNYGEGSNLDFSEDGAASDNGTLTGILTICIVTVGKLIENLTAWTINFLTKTGNEFPWADLIIFNTIPILDVNFINPADGSLMKSNGSFTTIGNTIRNVYFTGLSIALGFMGIVDAIMAIRLAISSIASDKARYKEAIVTWLTALVLLFGAHFLLSFAFYLNEKLVEVASQIVTDATKNTTIQIGTSTESTENSSNSTTNNTANQNNGKIVSGLGEYFYNDAIGDVGSGFGALFTLSEAKPIPGVLYTILVIQSLMFLFAYFKRFFYVIILSVLAPFVIIYDFFTKSI